MGSLRVMEILLEEARKGTAVCMASHHLAEVEQLCQHVCILSQGRMAAQGSLEELLGTGDQELVLRGLDARGLQAVQDCVRQQGGEVLHAGRRRRQLEALFRSLQDGAQQA
jgi:ABC-type multidrug transport system ATPase subunit